MPTQFLLTTTTAGTGTGTITPSAGSISWSGATGTAGYTPNTVITLTAAPAAGSSFSAWSGCDSMSGTTCTVTMSAAKNVTAIFADTAPPTISADTAVQAVADSLSTLVRLPLNDNITVTHYYLSETNDDPVAGSIGWKPYSYTTAYSIPYTFSSFGTRTLYAWARDAAGNVSAPFTTTVTLVDAIPTVTAITPAPSASAVPLSTTIAITFSEAMDSATLNPNKLLRLGSAYIPGSATWNSGKTTCTFTPSAPLSYGTSYTITPDGVKDTTGNTLSTPYGSTFTTVPKPVNVIIPAVSLALSANSTLIDNKGAITVSGAMTAGTLNIAGQAVTLTVTRPDGTTTTIALTTDNKGGFTTDIRNQLTMGGRYTVQASAGSTTTSTDTQVTTIAPASSSASVIRVLDQSGVAIIVIGSITSGEGKDSHIKTAARVRSALLARGFAEADIITISSVPGNSGKTALTTALAQAKTAINAKPASLHLILVDHGDKGQFHMDSEVLTPAELGTLLDTFETGLSAQALDQPRYITIGACYSGTFIDTIKKSGRTVITSAKGTEQSFRGPKEPDNVRSGEYFLDEYYGALKKGKSIRDAFNLATASTASYTRRGGIVSSFGDRPMQNPLISVGGSIGTAWLPTGYDDNAPDTLYLGTGDDATFSPSQVRTDKTARIEAIFLDENSYGATISTPGTAGKTAWFEYRAPSAKLTATGGSSQLEVSLPKVTMNYDNSTGSYSAAFDNFYEQGSYDIVIYLQDAGGDITRNYLTLYRNRSGNQAPEPFAPLAPADSATVQSTLVPAWAMTSDPDGDMLSYTLVISKTADMANPVLVKEGLTTPYAIINYEDGLLDQTTYYWQVWAIDSYGANTRTTPRSITTDNTNGFLGLIKGYIRDADGAAVAGAAISLGNGITTTSARNGAYVILLPPGDYTLAVTAGGYTGKSVSLTAVPGQVVTSDHTLSAIVPTQYAITVTNQGLGQGYFDCPATAKEGTQVFCTIQPGANYKLLKIEGDCTGTRTGNSYSFTASANCTIRPAFNAIIQYGDCDNNGQVTIAEVQSAINIFLGLKPVEACVDYDRSGSVSIAEVQKAINSFLGL